VVPNRLVLKNHRKLSTQANFQGKNGLDTSQEQAEKLAKAIVTSSEIKWQHSRINCGTI
jgi:hypothetical protein